MNKKQPETTKRTKQRLKASFWEIYKQKKIENITVKDITSKAGYNRSTFYAYFTDVYDVLEKIEQDVMPGREHLPPVDVKPDQTSDFVNDLIRIYEINSEYFSVLLSENGNPSFAIKFKTMLKNMMKESLLDGHPQISEAEADYALEFLASATISTVKHWYDNDKNISVEELLHLIYQLMDNQFAQRLYHK